MIKDEEDIFLLKLMSIFFLTVNTFITVPLFIVIVTLTLREKFAEWWNAYFIILLIIIMLTAIFLVYYTSISWLVSVIKWNRKYK